MDISYNILSIAFFSKKHCIYHGISACHFLTLCVQSPVMGSFQAIGEVLRVALLALVLVYCLITSHVYYVWQEKTKEVQSKMCRVESVSLC